MVKTDATRAAYKRRREFIAERKRLMKQSPEQWVCGYYLVYPSGVTKYEWFVKGIEKADEWWLAHGKHLWWDHRVQIFNTRRKAINAARRVVKIIGLEHIKPCVRSTHGTPPEKV